METKTRSASEMVRRVREDPERLEALKENPLPELEKLSAEAEKVVPAYMMVPTPKEDPLLYRMVVATLGLAILLSIIGGIVLAVLDKAFPDVIVAIGSASVGALAGLLAPSPAR